MNNKLKFCLSLFTIGLVTVFCFGDGPLPMSAYILTFGILVGAAGKFNPNLWR